MAQHQEHDVNKVLAGPRLCRDSLGLEGARKGTNHTPAKWGLNSAQKEELWKRQSSLLAGNNGSSWVPVSPECQCCAQWVAANPALSWTPAHWQPAAFGKFPEF